MKAVTIRGMEMPKNCRVCPIKETTSKGNMFCELANALMTTTGIKERHPDCPLIETVIEEEVVIPLVTLSKILDGDKTTYDFSEYVCGVNGLACSGCSLFCEHRRSPE